LPVAQTPRFTVVYNEFEQVTSSKYAPASLYTFNVLPVHLQTMCSFHDRVVWQIEILYLIKSLAFFFTNSESLKFPASSPNPPKHCSYFGRALYSLVNEENVPLPSEDVGGHRTSHIEPF
jgi:hypothetical protein